MAERLFFRSKSSSKYRMAEMAIMARLSSRFETEVTVNNKELYDTNVLKALLYVVGNRDDEVNTLTHNFLIKDAYRLKIFMSPKVRTAIQEGKILDGLYKLEDVVDRKWSCLTVDTFRLFNKVLICLFEYFDFETYAKKNIDNALKTLGLLLAYCFTLTAESYALKEYSQLSASDREEFLKDKVQMNSKESSWDNSVKNNPLKGEYLTFVQNKSIRDDFAVIYEAIFKPWYFELFGVDKGLRNDPKCLEGLELKNNWDVLFAVLGKDYYKNPSSASGSYDVLYTPRVKHSKALKMDVNTDVSDYLISCVCQGIQGFKLNFLQDIYNSNVAAYLNDLNNKNSQEKSNLVAEIKELKSVNRGLSKSVTKLNAEVEGLKRDIEQNRVELEEAKKVELESQELLDLRQKVEDLVKANESLTNELRKSEYKNTWYEEKVAELETDLRTYDGVEQTLMVLQNENNLLIADIERIELIENAEDEDSDFERKLNTIRDEPILFIGGSGDMLSKYVELFPNSECINISDNNPNFSIPARMKYVAIYTKVMKHCFGERAESFVDKENIIYLNILNKKLVIDELYKKIVGHKS